MLFDSDIGPLANVDVQLGLTPKHDLSEVFFNRQCPSLKDVITPFAHPNFDAIAGQFWLEAASRFPARPKAGGAKEAVARAARRHYDYIIIDLGAGVEEHVRTLAAIASRCIVVVTDEPTSLTDAYAFIKLFTNGSSGMDIGIVINQSATLKEGERTYASLNKACTNFLQTSRPPCLGIIRKDGKVKDTIRQPDVALWSARPIVQLASDAATITIKLMQK